MAEDKAPGSDCTGTEKILSEEGTPPRNPWIHRRPQPASADQDPEREREPAPSPAEKRG
ncbi:hypothetical protein ACFOD4_14435 [Pseudoroseomonas globiformis]|uniref:Uncharacterized protein n=1 Tax=Teichococcus globiformis TaxID=2307229 RepID=A0ABV7G5G6_9PROT